MLLRRHQIALTLMFHHVSMVLKLAIEMSRDLLDEKGKIIMNGSHLMLNHMAAAWLFLQKQRYKKRNIQREGDALAANYQIHRLGKHEKK